MTDPPMYNVASAVLCHSLAIVRSLPLPGCGVCGAHVEPLLRTSDWSGGGSGPGDPAGDGRAIVVLVGCLMSLGGHLLGPVGICPPCFPFIRCIVVLCLCRGWVPDPCSQFGYGRSSHGCD